MRALVVRSLQPDFAGCSIDEIAEPVLGAGDVRVRVRAAAVNFPDLLQTHGGYQHKPQLPFVPGLEFAGEVLEVGKDVSAFAVGDEVVGGGQGSAAMAEQVRAPADSLRRKGANLTFSEAAAFGTAYLTAYVALVRRAALAPGEWVLVHGAAGGVGSATVDMARALGARVIAASACDYKLGVLGELYAPDALVNVIGGFHQSVLAITGGRGADVVFDPVGGDVFDESTRCIAFNGRLLTIGFTSGRLPTLPVNIALIKGFSLMGVRAGEYGRRFPNRGREDRDAIWRMVEEGHVRPHVHQEYDLADWRAAFDALAQRQVIGKAILRPDWGK